MVIASNITAVRVSVRLRTLSAMSVVGLVVGCSGTPTAPDGGASTTLQITPGPAVLRVLAQSRAALPCRLPNIDPIVFTAVTLTRAGSEWVAKARSTAAGDVELRIRTVAANPAATLVAGTIKGTAVHMPALAEAGGLVGLVGGTRINFGSDGRTTLDGVVFPLSPGTSTGAFDGTGTGSISIVDERGGSCSQTGFSWMLFLQPSWTVSSHTGEEWLFCWIGVVRRPFSAWPGSSGRPGDSLQGDDSRAGGGGHRPWSNGPSRVRSIA
jgi:hypothetical protein